MAKGEIFVAGLMQNCAVEKKSSGWLDCARIIMPEIRREEPRPSERFSGGHGISRDRTVLENRSFNRDRAPFNQIETVGWLTGAENNFVFLELFDRGGSSQNFDMMRAHSSQEWMSRQTKLKLNIPFHIMNLSGIFSFALPFLGKINP